MRVVRVSPKKRRPNIYVVEFDDGESLDVRVEIAQQFCLYTDAILDEEQLLRILRADEELRCRDAAWRLLNHRPRSSRELERGLRQRKFSQEIVRNIVSLFVDRGYVDDTAFAKLFAEERLRKKDGPRLIEQELKKRGLGAEEIQEARELLGGTEEQGEAARELLVKWNRRSKPEDQRKRRMAAAAFLARRGYDSDVVWATVRDVLGSEDAEA